VLGQKDGRAKEAKLLEEDGNVDMAKSKRGLWDNIHAKRKRIKAGSGEKMRAPGSKGAPTAKAFRDSAVKKMKKGGLVKSGIAKACGAVMDDRRKVTKYY
jgi:hypothetical protein